MYEEMACQSWTLSVPTEIWSLVSGTWRRNDSVHLCKNTRVWWGLRWQAAAKATSAGGPSWRLPATPRIDDAHSDSHSGTAVWKRCLLETNGTWVEGIKVTFSSFYMSLLWSSHLLLESVLLIQCHLIFNPQGQVGLCHRHSWAQCGLWITSSSLFVAAWEPPFLGSHFFACCCLWFNLIYFSGCLFDELVS